MKDSPKLEGVKDGLDSGFFERSWWDKTGWVEKNGWRVEQKWGSLTVLRYHDS